MGEKMFTIVVHHHGHFVNYPFLCYDGGKIDFFENVNPDFLSYFEVVHALKELVLRMVDDLKNFEQIDLYAGELSKTIAVDVVDKDSKKNTDIHTTNGGIQRDSFIVSEELEMDLVDVHVGMPEKDYNEGSDQSDHFSERSDLQFFLDGDMLSDTCDILDKDDADFHAIPGVASLHDPNLDSLVAAEIDREYAEYVRSREKGKHQENVVIRDLETLDVPYRSEQEEENWLEFNKERDMAALELKARLVFSSVYICRKALIEYLIS
ncbi:hypothetical protein M9H77_03207 [Catharanthus roseus]|uniref:Uncharacterized protein n=1 Tax=Catharanthus roseus TaxID=4058 RepID=A0ACC0CAJ0_CATRO|nr:hypothetical protein M9H77_03207 [Catharanthus roseus]